MTDLAAIRRGLEGSDGVDVGWALNTVLRWFQRSAADAVADLPVSPRGFSILKVVATGGCRNQAEIADTLGLDRTVLTYLLDELENAEVVQRRPDPRDRRARHVVATDTGLALLDELRTRLDGVQAALLRDLGERDAAQFVDLVGRLADKASAAGHDTVDCGLPDDDEA